MELISHTVSGLKRAIKQFSPTQQERFRLSSTYLKGDGIEVGALHSPLRVTAQARVKYVDRLSRTDLLRHYPELASTGVVDPDIVDDGELLTTIADDSLDFIIANHFIEHCEDPIRTLQNFVRKLKSGGVIYMAVPDKRFNFDVERASTAYEHLRSDHADGGVASRRDHYFDFTRHSHFRGKGSEAEVQSLAERWLSEKYSIHFHVWTFDEFSSFVRQVQTDFIPQLTIVESKRNRDEGIFVLRKS